MFTTTAVLGPKSVCRMSLEGQHGQIKKLANGMGKAGTSPRTGEPSPESPSRCPAAETARLSRSFEPLALPDISEFAEIAGISAEAAMARDFRAAGLRTPALAGTGILRVRPFGLSTAACTAPFDLTRPCFRAFARRFTSATILVAHGNGYKVDLSTGRSADPPLHADSGSQLT